MFDEFVDLQNKYHEFRKADFNNTAPNAVFMSVDIFHTFLKSALTINGYMHRDIENPDKWTVIGLDILVVENKRDFLYVARV